MAEQHTIRNLIPRLVSYDMVSDRSGEPKNAHCWMLSSIQDLLGQTDGGIASLYFDEDEWNSSSSEQRRVIVHNYLNAEIAELGEI